MIALFLYAKTMRRACPVFLRVRLFTSTVLLYLDSVWIDRISAKAEKNWGDVVEMCQ